MNPDRRTFTVRFLLKGSAIIIVLTAYLLASAILSLAPVPAGKRRRLRAGAISLFSRLALRVFGIRVRVKHPERARPRREGRLVIANHVSYVDVLVLASIMPAVFITSVELRDTPLLGVLARLGGSLFVERRRPGRLKQEIREVGQVLAEGCSVALFPEGTTSNGDRVHAFKRALFDAAVGAGCEVLPLCIRYTAINGRPVGPENRDGLFYYGGVRFSEHFPRFLKLRTVRVEVSALRTLTVHAQSSRKDLAAAAHELIAGAYHSQ